MTGGAGGAARSHPDHVYQLLVDSYAGLSAPEAAAFHARLVLLLIDRIGDVKEVAEAVAEARRAPAREITI